jgi:hypothetical protein
MFQERIQGVNESFLDFFKTNAAAGGLPRAA